MHSTIPDGKAARRGSALVRFSLLALAALSAAAESGCLDRPLCDVDCTPRTTNLYVDTLTQRSPDKIDLLFMIDNSSSMADKQVVLRDAVPDLVKRLVSPTCVDPHGHSGETPADPAGLCGAGFAREFRPIRDIHVGVITSSLGGHGGAACSPTRPGPEGEEGNDQGHLVATRPRFAGVRGDPQFATGQAPEPPGFLDWNPVKRPGQSVDAFNKTFSAMVVAADEHGCGYEAQLESIYRFLVDPSPSLTIEMGTCPNSKQSCAVPRGRDDELLRERAAFLRPDSLVAIIMMTDENDCSIRDGGQAFYAANSAAALPRAAQACVTNPNDPCCYPCGSKPPAGCAEDPTCATAPTQKQDEPNLRCFEQTRRFGADFLYPTQRYVNALSQPRLCTSRADLAFDPHAPGSCPDADGDHQPDVVTNPLLAGPDGAPGGRLADDVFLAGIVGVPWQDLARPRAGTEDAGAGAKELHYRTATELSDEHVWDVVLGDPHPVRSGAPVPPIDALMVESMDPRGGTDGETPPRPLAGPSSPPMQNPVNGHEWANGNRDDLEYACIFPLPVDPATGQARRSCAASATSSAPSRGCDCSHPGDGSDNPLCQNPQTGAYGTDQYFAKAYPGLRELEVLRDFGKNAIVASICARNLDLATKDTAQDYGYRPAVDAIVDRLKVAINGRCLPRVLTETPDPANPGQMKVACSIIEVRRRTAGAACDPAQGRSAPSPALMDPIFERLASTGVCGNPGGEPCSDFLLCEIDPAGEDCHHADAETTRPGWCYVDPVNHPGRDDPALVASCEPSAKRMLRFVDRNGATPAHGARVLIACFGADLSGE